MQRTITIASVLVALIAWSTSAFAQEEVVKALWIESGLDEGEALRLRESIADQEMDLIDERSAAQLLGKLAKGLPRDTRGRITKARLRQAREAYVELRLGPAAKAYDQAIRTALRSDRTIANAGAIADMVFGRALVRLASQRGDDALADMSLALSLRPDLAPDPDVYGPPVFRLLTDAREKLKRSQLIGVRIDRAPEDASVRLDGKLVRHGEEGKVRGPGRHLLTAQRFGYVPQSRWVEVDTAGQTQVAVALERAQGSLLAGQALAAWRRASGGGKQLRSDVLTTQRGLLPLVARAVGAIRVVRLTAKSSGEIELAILDTETGEVLRTARSDRAQSLAESFETLTSDLSGPPGAILVPGASAQVSLVVTAPSAVEPSRMITLSVGVSGKRGLVDRLEARCGEAHTDARLSEIEGGTVMLHLAAPDDEGSIRCTVRALDGEGRLLAQAPEQGREMTLDVAEMSDRRPWYRRWYVWGVIGIAAAAIGVTAGVLVGTSREPEQVWVVHGP